MLKGSMDGKNLTSILKPVLNPAQCLAGGWDADERNATKLIFTPYLLAKETRKLLWRRTNGQWGGAIIPTLLAYILSGVIPSLLPFLKPRPPSAL